jgi:hypothetical protein
MQDNFKEDCGAVTGLKRTENEENRQQIKDEVVPVNGTKASSGSRCTPLLILNFGTRCRPVIKFTARLLYSRGRPVEQRARRAPQSV